MPRSSLNLLPFKMQQQLLIKHNEWYRSDFKFKWAFCKYFWESHVEMPDIDIEQLKLITEPKDI